ncbi:MAG: RNA polymerase sigma factor [Burkholderiaceae bacterium]|nr:RNA polymerase sigma factor [Burkholderiaceae bacterium]
MSGGFTIEQLQAQIPRLRRYARALTGSREAADDLTQDTLERAWTKRALWRSDSDLRAWLFAVMHNVFVNGTKRKRATVSVDAAWQEGAPEPAAGEHSTETRAALRDMQRALAQLPPEQREVVLLIGLEQLTYAEAARVLDVPIGTVMSRLSRARDRLRQILDEAAAGRGALRRVK